MNRRNFMLTAGAAGLAVSTTTPTFAQMLQPKQSQRQNSRKKCIELRVYTVADLEKKEKLIRVFDEALIPALNRQGIKPVGVFWTNKDINEGKDEFDLSVFVLYAHDSMESALQTNAKLLADKTLREASAAIFEASMAEPRFTTLKSTLMTGFNLCPGIEVPTLAKDRVLQLRYYKSYNFERNAAKIHMFDEGGELALFRKVGMHPVFFGDTVFGDMMPNLTYMLGFENEDARKLAWKTFVESPEWADIKGRPMYKDTANTIVNIMLKPSPGSQI
ncbi:MAG: NIPSNAP family protein [Planctomycetaceae bacterium]|nr:NIPSNAP family protein [Planctomycetaceae bacterium]